MCRIPAVTCLRGCGNFVSWHSPEANVRGLDELPETQHRARAHPGYGGRARWLSWKAVEACTLLFDCRSDQAQQEFNQALSPDRNRGQQCLRPFAATTVWTRIGRRSS